MRVVPALAGFGVPEAGPSVHVGDVAASACGPGSIALHTEAAIVIGLVNALVTPILSISQYRDMTPFILATIALLVLSELHARGTIIS